MATLQRPESNFDALETPLYGVTARLRLVRLVRFASRGALIGIGLSLIALVLNDLSVLADWFSLYVFIPLAVLAGGGVGAAVGGLQRVSLSRAAALAESRLGLKERISSAMEFARDPANYGKDAEAALLLRLQQEDAVFHARMIRPSKAVPFKISWETKALIPAFVVLLLAIIVPALFAFFSPRARNEQAIVAQTGIKIVRSADDLEKEAAAHRMAETLRLAQAMHRVGEQMRHGRMDKREAMLKMAGLNKQIDDARKALNATAGLSNPNDLQSAGQQLAKELAAEKNLLGNIPNPAGPKKGFTSPNSGQSSSAKILNSAADSMQEDNAMGLGDQLRKLANRLDTQSLSPQEQKQAADGLDKLSQALKGTTLQDAKQHVQAAADALHKGDKGTAANELRKAADSIDKAMQQAQDAQQDSSGLDQADSAVQDSQDTMAKAQKPGQVNTKSSVSQGQSGQQGQSGKQGQSGQQGHSGHGSQHGQQGQSGQGGQGQSGQGQSGQSGQGGQGQSGQSGQGGQGQSGQSGQGGQGQSGQSGQGGQGQSGQSGQGGQGQSGQSGQGGQGQSGQSGQGGQGQSGQSGQGSDGNSGSGGTNNGGSSGRSSSSGGNRSQGQGSTGHSPGTTPPSRSWQSDPHMQAATGKFAIPPGNKSGYKGGTDSAPRMSLPSDTMGQQQSKVPYEQEVDQARRTSESAMDSEDIAPADRALVRKYYDALAQSH